MRRPHGSHPAPHPIIGHLRRRQLEAEAHAAADRAIVEAGGELPDHPNDSRHALPGDPWKLRGIPVVGVHGGVGGAIPGSKPGHGLYRLLYVRGVLEQREGGKSMKLGQDQIETLKKFRQEGLVWLANAAIFHPRGYALTVHLDDDGEPYGLSVQGDGLEPWHYGAPVDVEGPFVDFTRAEMLRSIARGG